MGTKFRIITNKRDLLIYKFQKDYLGYTQEEIADMVVKAGYEKKFSHNRVSVILSQFSEMKKVTNFRRYKEKCPAGKNK